MRYETITPLFFVDQIEPSLFFWVGRLGFQKTAEVHENGKLGFVMLVKDQTQIMYQTFSSLEKDLPNVLALVQSNKASATYIKVSDIDWISKHLDGVEVLVPFRTTFYGAKEICVKEPAGNVVIFAEFKSGKAEKANL